MTIRVVGAGLGRTGTHSLKMALEQLLDGPCYHMIEVFGHPEHIPVWHAAMRDEPVDWAAVFDGYVAVVDYPGCGRVAVDRRRVPGRAGPALDPELHRCLVAQRQLDDPRGRGRRGRGRRMAPWKAMSEAMFARTGVHGEDEAGSKAAYERHNAEVRAEVPGRPPHRVAARGRVGPALRRPRPPRAR